MERLMPLLPDCTVKKNRKMKTEKKLGYYAAHQVFFPCRYLDYGVDISDKKRTIARKDGLGLED